MRWAFQSVPLADTKPTHPARRGFFVLFKHAKLTQPVISQQSIERLGDVEIPCSGITPSASLRRIAAFRTFAVGHASGQHTQAFQNRPRKNKMSNHPAGPATYSAYEQATREFLNFLGPAGMLRRLDSISESDIERFVALLRSEGRSASTINKLVRKYLSLPFERARKTGKIKFNPVMATVPERGEAFAKDTFTGEQVAAMVRVAKGTDWEGAILFAYGCGVRLGDVANLRWTNLDIEAGAT
jgi:integrase